MTRKTPRSVLAVTAIVFFLLHAPVLALMIFSFNQSRYGVSWTGFTIDWYRKLLGNEAITRGLARSIAIGLGSTLIATILGTLFALGLERGRIRGKKAAGALLIGPLVTPEIIMGISLLGMFATLAVPLGYPTILIAHVTFSISYVAAIVQARLRGMDSHLEEAALMLGANEWAAFWRVTFPLLLPGITAGALLAFTMSFDDYVITSFVSGSGTSTLPVVIYGMVRRNIEPTINAVSTVIVATTGILIYCADRLRDRPERRFPGSSK